MKKSVVLPAFFSDSVRSIKKFEEALHEVHSYRFYDAVELYYEGTAADRQRIRTMLESFGLSSVFLAGFSMKRDKLNLGDLDDHKRDNAIRRVSQLIDEAYDVGSEKMLIVSGPVYPTYEENQLSLQRLAESVKQLCDYAQQMATDHVLELSLEYFNDVGEPYYLLGPTERSRQFAEYVRAYPSADNFRLTYDMSHAIQLKEDPFDSLSIVWPLTRHIHLANCVTRDPDDAYFGDKHPPIGWRNSDLDEEGLKDFVSCIYSLNPGIHTILGIEIITPEGMDNKKVLHEATQLFMEAVKINEASNLF